MDAYCDLQLNLNAHSHGHLDSDCHLQFDIYPNDNHDLDPHFDL